MTSGFSEKPSELSSSMSSIVQASSLVQSIAGPNGSQKDRLLRAYRRIVARCNPDLASFSFNRVKDLFYQDARCHVWADELSELKRIARVRDEEQEARSEYAELQARIARLEALLVAQDPEFHGPQALALRASLPRRGSMDSPLD